MVEFETNACEMCGRPLQEKGWRDRRWHQTDPVERWLCQACGRADQTANKNWTGHFYPADWDTVGDNDAH